MSDKKDVKLDELTVNGVTYVRADAVPAPVALKGKRAVIVVDRGWIVAGDVTEENGRIKLSRALHVFNWKQGGFTAMVQNPKLAGADLRPLPNGFDLPNDSEIFRVPVEDSWGV